MKKFILPVLVSLICASVMTGQRTCGNETADLREAAAFPNQTEINKKIFQEWRAEREASGRSSVPVTIPVHIIVVHGLFENVGQGSNVDMDRINSQIQVLNDDFARTNSDASNTPAVFDAAGTEISFCLATVDPDGNATNGVTRYPTGNDFQQTETTIVSETIWPPTRYLNIYLAPELNGLLGYSSRPNPGQLPQTNNDVVRVLTGAFGGEGFATAAPYDLGRTATHEVGHWLGLRHPWGNGGCTSDDGFDDTPIQTQDNFGCPNHPSPSCNNGGDMFMNYMDYVNDDCMNAFSQEQADFMDLILTGTRTQLLNSAGTACLPSGAPIVTLVDKQDIRCPGDMSGSIQLTATSGVPPYTYSLNGGTAQADGIFNNLPGGNHEIIVSTSEGLTSSYTFNIAEPDPMVFNVDVVSDACSGLTNGIASIQTEGGNGDISSLSVFNSTYNSMQSDIYLETFAGGMPADWTIDGPWQVGTSEELSSSYWPIPENDHCLVYNDDALGPNQVGNGSVTTPTINLNGATAFTVSFDGYYVNGGYANFFESAVVNISSDEGVTWEEVGPLVGDANWITYSFDITDYPAATIRFRFDYSDGGGWNFGLALDNLSVAPSGVGTFENLSAGVYTVLAVDSENCEYSTTFEVLESDPIMVSNIDVITPGCDGLGEINISAASANGIQAFELNGVINTTGQFVVSGAGTYTINITDNSGCAKDTTVVIDTQAGISLSASTITNITCNGGSDGSISIDVGGAQGAMTVTLNGAEVQGTTFSSLVAGDYEITINDAAGCFASIVVNITEPPVLNVSGIVTPAGCTSLGSIEMTSTGGTPPFVYSIDNVNFQSTNTYTDLKPGTYNITGRDANGCEEAVALTVTDDFSLVTITETIVDCSHAPVYLVELCTDDNSAADWTIFDNQGATIMTPGNGACVTIDLGPFLSTTNDDYFFAAEAASPDGCVSEINSVAYQTTTLDNSLFDNLTLCEGEQLALLIDNQDEFESIEVVDSNGDDPTGPSGEIILQGGNTYTFTTTDLRGCTDSFESTIVASETPMITVVDQTDATSSTGGSVTLEGSGGAGDYTFMVNGIENTTGMFDNLPADDYIAIISDINGCTSDTVFTINLETATEDIQLSSSISLFPNPVSSELFVSLEGNELIEELWIYSTDGREVKHLNVSGQQLEINVSDIESGLYIVSLRSGEKMGYKKFLRL